MTARVFVQLLQDLDFNKEKVEVVSLGAGAEKVPPIDGLLPLRVPIIGGSTKGWMLPNARRGAEQVAVDADTSGERFWRHFWRCHDADVCARLQRQIRAAA